MTTSPVVTITEELVAELEAIREDASSLTPDCDAQEYLGNLAARILAERADMQSQIKAGIVTQDNLELYRKDALRYQWLRDTLRHDSKRWADAGEWNHSNIEPHDFDSAVDQAMQEQKP